MAQSGKCVPCKCEDLRSIFSFCIEKENFRCEGDYLEEVSESLVSEASLFGEFQSSERPCPKTNNKQTTTTKSSASQRALKCLLTNMAM